MDRMNFIYGVSTDVSKFFSTNLNAGMDYVKANKPVQVAIVVAAVAAFAALAYALKRVYEKYFTASVVVPANVESEAAKILAKLTERNDEATSAGVLSTDPNYAKLRVMVDELKKAQDGVKAAITARDAAAADKKADAEKEVANKHALLFKAYNGWEALVTEFDKTIATSRAAQLEAAKDPKAAYELLIKRKGELEHRSTHLNVLYKEFEAIINGKPSITSTESAKKVFHKIDHLVKKMDDEAKEAADLEKIAVKDNAYKADAEAAMKVVEGIYLKANNELEVCKKQLHDHRNLIGYVAPIEQPTVVVAEPPKPSNLTWKNTLGTVGSVGFPILGYMGKLSSVYSMPLTALSVMGLGYSNYDRLKSLVTPNQPKVEAATKV